jgi:hypothetical protein
MGWQGLATCGQFLSLIGVSWFFIMLGVSHWENRYSLESSLGFVRWQKRAHYYLFKVKWNRKNEDVAQFLPNAEARVLLRDESFSEYEVFKTL